MATLSVADLITQGYKIIDSNTIFAGEPWEIVDPLLTEFDTAFHNLRDAQSLCLNLRVEKSAAADKNKIARDEADHAISRLKRFIKYIADEDTADNMIRDLAIVQGLPADNDEAVTVLMSNVLPHLDDWDGTPHEISAAIKTEVNDATTAFAAAVLESSQKQDLSEVATQDRDLKRDVFEDILSRIRSFLHLMLPLERKDERLELYGFDVWGKSSGGGGGVPTEFTASVTKIGPGVWDFWCSKPADVVDAKVEMQALPDGPIKIVTEHMTIEEGVFVPFRARDLKPGDYKAFFTAYDSGGAQWGDVVAVEFTVEPY